MSRVACVLCLFQPAHAKQPFLFPFSQMREAREALETRDTACKFFSVFFFFQFFFPPCPCSSSALLSLCLSASNLKIFIFLWKVNITTRNCAKILCDLNTTSFLECFRNVQMFRHFVTAFVLLFSRMPIGKRSDNVDLIRNVDVN